jgi:two-component system cell cycle response regulator
MSTPADRARILLVDDSMLMRKAATKMLGDEFEVVTAVDGEDGWNKVQADHAIQVVFTDLLMPKLDGYGLLQKIRSSEDEGTLNLPVIVVTGAENDESARRKALDLGATDFITKPFSSVDLMARARAHANYRRIAKRLEQQATLDALTGLANKAGYLDRLQQTIAFALRHAQPLTIVRIDIDDFRNIFLKRGKASAEALVAHVARVLHDTVRQEDTAARVGLASFALALPAGQYEGSKGLIERLRARFASDDFAVEGRTLPFTISAGVVAPHLREALLAKDAFDACEAVLQLALRDGGNRVEGRQHTTSDLNETSGDTTIVATTPTAGSVARLEASRTPSAPKAANTTQSEVAPIVAAATPVESIPSPMAEPVERVDEALACIDRGESLAVVARLPALLKRLSPLFRLLSANQRAQLIAYLQKLGA